jgi:hypothetical protein
MRSNSAKQRGAHAIEQREAGAHAIEQREATAARGDRRFVARYVRVC